MKYLLDQYGRELPAIESRRPAAGAFAQWEPADRDQIDPSRDLTPERVDAIMRAADQGDTAQMCRLSERIDDKSLDIGAALATRRAAVAATPWRVRPSDDSAAAKALAEEAEAMLRSPRLSDGLIGFDALVEFDLLSALLPGFACPEIVWGKGGDILGFQTIEQRHFTFQDSRTPKLVTTSAPQGMELPYGKFCLHWHRAKSGDAVRGGLVRSLAWIHCFQSVNVKDLLRFVERYGFPFTVAKVDDNTWKTERNLLKALIRNFGPDGGGVFSKNTELELLQAANNTGEVYFRLLDYLGRAAEKIILGQTATSGEGGGWSNDGAQHLVRMDIRDSDCRQIANTANARILAPWTLFGRGPKAVPPQFEFDVEAAKDAKERAEVIGILETAGLEVEEEQVFEETGFRVTRRAPAPPPALALSEDRLAQTVRRELAAILQPGRDALALAAESAVSDVPERVAESALPAARRALGPMLGPLQARLDALAGMADDAQFARGLAALGDDLPGLLPEMDSAALEQALAETVHGAMAAGMAGRAAELKRREARG